MKRIDQHIKRHVTHIEGAADLARKAITCGERPRRTRGSRRHSWGTRLRVAGALAGEVQLSTHSEDTQGLATRLAQERRRRC